MSLITRNKVIKYDKLVSFSIHYTNSDIDVEDVEQIFISDDGIEIMNVNGELSFFSPGYLTFQIYGGQ